MSNLLIDVKFGKDVHRFELPPTATLLDLKRAIEAKLNVPCALQKIMGKPNLKDDAAVLGPGGLNWKAGPPGVKLMLVGATAEAVKEAVAEPKEKAEERQKQYKAFPLPFWLLSPFSAMLADPYVEGKGGPLEGGTHHLALVAADMLLTRINTMGTATGLVSRLAASADSPTSPTPPKSLAHRFLNMSGQDAARLAQVHTVLRKACEYSETASQAVEPPDVLTAVNRAVEIVTDVSPGEWALLPFGYIGKISRCMMYMLVSPKPNGTSYRVVLCNRGSSAIEYHPSVATAAKIKTKACVEIEVTKERITDTAWWMIALSQWMKSNNPDVVSEYNRSEVIYDVLLPWLVQADATDNGSSVSLQFANAASVAMAAAQGQPPSASSPATRTGTGEPPLKAERADPATAGADAAAADAAAYSTPMRSESSATKALYSALSFLLRDAGMSAATVKQLKFALRFEAMSRAAEELLLAGRRWIASPSRRIASPPVATAAGTAVAVSPTPEDQAEKTREQLAMAIKNLEAVGVNASETVVTLDQMFSAMTPSMTVRSAVGAPMRRDQFEGKVVGLYFSGSWCPPCKQFSPLLVELYGRIKNDRPDIPFEIIFISCDRSVAEFNTNVSDKPWPRMSFPCQEIHRAYDITSVPTFMLFGPDGTLLTNNGVEAMYQDPDAEKFPNSPWNGGKIFTETDQAMLRFASGQVAYHALKRHDAGELSDPSLAETERLLHAIDAVVVAMPSNVPGGAPEPVASTSLPDAAAQAAVARHSDTVESVLQGKVPADAGVVALTEMLATVPTTRYYGQLFASTLPDLENLSRFRVPPASLLELDRTIADATAMVKKLWARAKHTGTASRVAIQMQIIEFVTFLFTVVIPIPAPANIDDQVSVGEAKIASAMAEEPQPDPTAAPPAATPDGEVAAPTPAAPPATPSAAPAAPAATTSSASTAPKPKDPAAFGARFYLNESFSDQGLRTGSADGTEAPGDDMQFDLMKRLLFLALSYGTAWQAVDVPTRPLDSERCLTAAAMLCVFDAVARNMNGATKCFMLTFLMADDGGFHLSTTMCRDTRSFENVAASLEITRPHMLPVRAHVVEYQRWVVQANPKELFDLRMPDKFEIRKHSNTVIFLRRFLENCGYEIMARQGGMGGPPPSEMEALMGWLLDGRSPLGREHPEFHMLRDMVLVVKFLGTMEMRDAQLLQRRKQLDEFATWRISFDEDVPGRQMSAGWRTSPHPPLWELLTVRGRDLDIADVSAKAFGDRELAYGEGLVVQSPADVSRLIGCDHPTEDDVLHCQSLPSFSDALSEEESSLLLSCLTVPYVRIPLVLDFFAQQDRHMYLFSGQLQQLLRSVLFEPAPYVSKQDIAAHALRPLQNLHVPMRLSALQKKEHMLAQLQSATVGDDPTKLLGTTHGLLLNELSQAQPHLVLGPLAHMVKSLRDLGPKCSVYSANASFVLYLLGLVADTLRYADYAMENVSVAAPAALSQAALELRQAVIAHVEPLIKMWDDEACASNDTPTQCAVAGYKALLVRAVPSSAFASVLAPHATDAAANAPQFPAPASDEDGVAEVEAAPKTEEQLRQQERERELDQQSARRRRELTHAAALLSACAFVRVRHGFGMGMLRTQLAAQQGDSMLSGEEKFMRFLQAQGLDTRHVSKTQLEQGKKLMLAGGRRRALFLQIRSRYHSDTVRIPNLVHADANSAADADAMRLPPVDVPEASLFALLQEENTRLTQLFTTMSTDEKNMVLNEIVKTVLRSKTEKKNDDKDSHPASPTTPGSPGTGGFGIDANETWDTPSAGVFKSQQTGLVFHLDTAELFWRSDELRPVPDSMSHFTDYEAVLGNDVLQCGLVSRSENRHWVHVVGTPYDLVEWTRPDIHDQGVYQPQATNRDQETGAITEAVFSGVTFNRPVVVEEQEPWPERSERWAIDLAKTVFKEVFPMPGQMKFPLLMRQQVVSEDEVARDNVICMLTNDEPQYENEEERNTWKEIIVTKSPRVLKVFNLVPHCRKMYRSLVYTTNTQLSLHSMVPSTRPRDLQFLATMRHAGGELLKRIHTESSLEIHRHNHALGGREVYVPARLLQGLIPSMLLERFFFWQGTDDIVRGEPTDKDDPWFPYAVEIRLPRADAPAAAQSTGAGTTAASRRRADQEAVSVGLGRLANGPCVVFRRPLKKLTRIATGRAARAAASAVLRREVSNDGAIPVSEAGRLQRRPPPRGRGRGGAGQWNAAGQFAQFLAATNNAGSDDDGDEFDEDDSDDMPPPPSAPIVDAASVAMLQEMFPFLSVAACEHALKASHGLVPQAVSFVTADDNRATLERINDEAVAAACQAEAEPTPAGDNTTAETAATADADAAAPAEPEMARAGSTAMAVTTGDEDALEAALDDDDEDSAGKGEDEDTAAIEEDAEGSAADGDAKFSMMLVSITDAPGLRPLATFLTSRLEDASHILAWARVPEAIFADDNVDGGNAAQTPEQSRIARRAQIVLDRITPQDLASIELPRLRLKLVPRPEPHGRRVRLFLADNPGWWLLCDPETLDTSASVDEDALTCGDEKAKSGQDRVAELAAPFSQHVFLRNAANERQLLVPNHEFQMLRVARDPMASLTAFDRSSFTWQETVATPYYLYQVHPSGAFLLPPTLSATLYLTVLLLASRRYGQAMRYAEACYVDTPFTAEEKFMYNLMDRTSIEAKNPDNHPDAHAVRLKLAHAVLHSPNKPRWELHVEVGKYLAKESHVSSDCRLSSEEVVDLLKRCNRGVPVVKARLEYHSAVANAARGGATADVSTVKLSLPHRQLCGQPWTKMLSYAAPTMESHSQKLTRMHYKKPQKDLKDTDLIKWLLEDELLTDEESGTNRQLGFFFMFLMARHQVNIHVGQKDITRSMGEILIRYFHLKGARWGKEFTDDGEAEGVPSYSMGVLAQMLSHRQHRWPNLHDRGALMLLRNGVNVHGPEARETELPQWLAEVDSAFRGALRDAGGETARHYAREVMNNSAAADKAREAALAPVPFRTPTPHLPGRVLPSNTGRSVATVPSATFSAAFFDTPLDDTGLLTEMLNVTPGAAADSGAPGSTAASSVLPFKDIAAHPAAQSHVGKDMLARMEQDMQTFRQQVRQAPKVAIAALRNPAAVLDEIVDAYSSGCSSADVAARLTVTNEAKAALRTLLAALEELTRRDAAIVGVAAADAETLANMPHQGPESDSPSAIRTRVARSAAASADAVGAPQHTSLVKWSLLRRCKAACEVTFEWLSGALLSTAMEADVARVNSMHGPAEPLERAVVTAMLHANRMHFSQQASQHVRQVLQFLAVCQVKIRRQFAVARHAHMSPQRSVVIDDSAVSPAKAAAHDMGRREDTVEGALGGMGVRAVSAEAIADTASMRDRLSLLCKQLVDQLTAKRHYAKQTDAGWTFDPRFLTFEFIFNILLRKRQVEMVHWFMGNLSEGRSRVQQMLMGQGKTTVVGPLLALMLSDGATLVTQVMPTPLLEQSRNVLRRCFSVVVPKQVLTLSFDRSCDDDVSVAEVLFQKLEAAVRHRSLVVAAPESIKALLLKFVEQLHAVEDATVMRGEAQQRLMTSLLPEATKATADGDEDQAVSSGAAAVGSRTGKDIARMQKKLRARSTMADSLVPILHLWRKGVLLMDEVDVLLHPLRSELNFPIGHRLPIDGSGPRWQLPIHLLDAVLAHSEGRAAAFADLELSKDQRTSALTVLGKVAAAIEEGYGTKTMQREPHMVLLDQTFYHDRLRPLLAEWLLPWLRAELPDPSKSVAARRKALRKLEAEIGAAAAEDKAKYGLPHIPDRVFLNFLLDASPLPHRDVIHSTFIPPAIQILNLARSWLCTVLPHVLSKINRVGYGLLREADLDAMRQEDVEKMPASRKLLAVPFVAKDVPSRSSEFAHPDVVIGLTILASRYEGMRENDIRALLVQLKQDYTRQAGPRDLRPAAVTYNKWVAVAIKRLEAEAENTGANSAPTALRRLSSSAPGSPTGTAPAFRGDAQATAAAAAAASASGHAGVVPLAQLQVLDPVQLRAVHALLARVPEVAHYNLCQHVFPRTMAFQQLKVSACGHELGGSILFDRRVGFSGTPSNLLPLDLGDCSYEPGSDGSMITSLTSSEVTTSEELPAEWTPKLLLERVAAAAPAYHALIDTGALITNMDNEQVAKYLMARLPASFEAVVFLDVRDRQVALLRSNSAIVPVAQCGVPLSRRFTFFDQNHTTGIDVKQAPTAVAVVTIGKDMVFRDYAQGAYRMRGIGRGQKLHLYLIPEVVSRVTTALGPEHCTGRAEIDVPAWLVLNAMRVEGLQFVKLSAQELSNVFRTGCLETLVGDVDRADTTGLSGDQMRRVQRFNLAGNEKAVATALRHAIQTFREPISYVIPDRVDPAEAFVTKVEREAAERTAQCVDSGVTLPESAALRASDVVLRLTRAVEAQTQAAVAAATAGGDHAVVPDEATLGLNAEVVHEQEAEEEQEQEAEQEEQRVSAFARDDEQHQPWSAAQLAQRPDQVGASSAAFYRASAFRTRPQQQPLEGLDQALHLSDNFFKPRWCGLGDRRLKTSVIFVEWKAHGEQRSGHGGSLYTAVSLAEGESLRWLVHHSPTVQRSLRCSLRLVSTSRVLDATPVFLQQVTVPAQERLNAGSLQLSLNAGHSGEMTPRAAQLFLRFMNGDMFYTQAELAVLEHVVLANVPDRPARAAFFDESLRLRRRHRNRWDDAPIAQLFLEDDEDPATTDDADKAVARDVAVEVDAESRTAEQAMAVAATQALTRIRRWAALRPTVAAKARARLIHAGKTQEADRKHDDDEDDEDGEKKDASPTESPAVKPVGGASLGRRIVTPPVVAGVLSPLVQIVGTQQEVAPWEVIAALGGDSAKQLTVDEVDAIFALTSAKKSDTDAAAPADATGAPQDDDEDGQAPADAFEGGINPALAAAAASAGMDEGTLMALIAAGVNVAAALEAEGHAVPPEAFLTAADRQAGPGGSAAPVDDHGGMWPCPQCTFFNPRSVPLCTMCNFQNPSMIGDAPGGGGGFEALEVPDGYWCCSVEHGGCSRFNPNSLFYCDSCDKARPDLATLRF